MELESVFYVVGIICMSLITIIIIVLAVAVFAIKAKITAIQHRIENKFHDVIEVAQTVL